MTNDKPKSNCCEAEMRVSSADEGTACYICLKCFEVCDPKPLPSEPKCEHEEYNKWAYYYELGTKHFLEYVYKKDVPICPYCKPVEPSVEAFNAELIQEIYDYCDYIRNSSGVARTICELIEERKNERNRK